MYRRETTAALQRSGPHVQADLGVDHDLLRGGIPSTSSVGVERRRCA